MKIVIDIPENMYKEYVSVSLGRGNGKTITDNLLKAIKNGTPLPEYHGRLISEEDMLSVIIFSKLFDDAKVGEVKEALRNIPTIIEGR